MLVLQLNFFQLAAKPTFIILASHLILCFSFKMNFNIPILFKHNFNYFNGYSPSYQKCVTIVNYN